MARCPGCGSDPGPNARFCSVCGTQVPGPAPSPAAQPPVSQRNPTILPGAGAYNAPGSPQPTGSYGGYGSSPSGDADGKRKVALAAGAGTAVVAIAGLIFLSASGLLGAKKPTTASGGVLTAPPAQPAQAPVLTAPPAQLPSAPVLEKPVAKNTPMPADVIDYLRWLKQYEAGRHQLEAKSASEMMLVLQEVIKVGMTGPSDWNLLGGDSEQPKENAKPSVDIQTINTTIQDWNQAAGIFQQRTPPDTCATLAGFYGQGLTQSVSTMTSLLNGALGAIQSIKDAGGEKTAQAIQTFTQLVAEKNSKASSGQIDQSFQQANASLDAVRAMYTDIPADVDRGQFQIVPSKGGGLGTLPVNIPGLGM